MSGINDKALIERAVNTYPTMLRALLSAMRTYQRNDEPTRAGTAPAALPLALACVLAVRLADDPQALGLAEALFAGGLAMQRGVMPTSESAAIAEYVLRMLEEKGVI